MSSLPLGYNQIEIQRSLTTSSTAIFVPFTTQELFQHQGEALYYGLNALSNNLIMVDRKRLKNPNGLILGTPGSGKSFSAKREILNDGMNGETSAAAYLLRAVGQLNRVTANILEITKAMVVYENAIDRILNNGEMPENDCAD